MPAQPPSLTAASPRTRELVAAALLGTLGALGFFVPLAFAALGPLLFSGHSHASGGERAVIVVSPQAAIAIVGQVPLIAVLALVAAAGLARRAAWARWLGVLVGSISLAALPYSLLVGDARGAIFLGTEGTGTPPFQQLVQDAEHHLFVLPGSVGSIYGIPHALFGAVVLFGLLTGRAPQVRAENQARERFSSPASAPLAVRLDALLLLLLAVSAFGPYLAWLVQAASTLIGPASDRADWLYGSLLLLAGVAAGGGAGVSAQSVRRRTPLAPYLAPPSAAMAGLWLAAWIFLATSGLLTDPELPSSGLLAVPVTLIALAGLLALPVTLLVVMVWQSPASAASAPVAPAARRPVGLRRASAAVAIAAVPVLLVGAVEFASPRPEPLSYRSVRLYGKVYQFRLPINSPGDRLLPVGSIDDWTADLQVSDPTAYAIDTVGIETAIVIAGSTTDTQPLLAFDLFVRVSLDRVPGEYCAFVPVDDPNTPPGPCGPPEGIVIGELDYWADTQPLVPASDLSPTGMTATDKASPPLTSGFEVLSIRAVPPADSVALRFGKRVLVYRANGAVLWLGHPLCAYPTVTGTPYDACFGIGALPETIRVNGQVYFFEFDYFDIPLEELTLFAEAEVVEEPFPDGMSPTVYRIAAIDPSEAVGLIHEKRVHVARPVEGDKQTPVGLCQYLRPDAFEIFGIKGGPTGCAEP